MPEISFEIIKGYGALSEDKTGWKKELNLVAWNNRAAKFDIRDWSPDHSKMGKGVTLNRAEAEKLRDLLTEALNSD